eukprot:4698208-Pyramimonas_sp.AAC.1
MAEVGSKLAQDGPRGLQDGSVLQGVACATLHHFQWLLGSIWLSFKPQPGGCCVGPLHHFQWLSGSI